MTDATEFEPALPRRRPALRAARNAALLILALSLRAGIVDAQVRGGYRVSPSDPPGGVSSFGIFGWAVSPCGTPQVRILLDGKDFSVLVPIYRLPEIRDRFPRYPGADAAGFWTSIDPAGLHPGPHVFAIRARKGVCGEASLGEIRVNVRSPVAAIAAVPALILLLGVVPFVLSGWLPLENEKRFSRLPLIGISALVFLAFGATIVLSGRFGETLLPTQAGIFSPLSNWDGEHYLRLAAQGYGGPGGEQEWGWFPLYPALLHALGVVTLPPPLLGSVLNFCCALGAVAVLRRLYPGRENGILSYALFPSAMFFVACYSEASFVLLLAATLASIKKEKALPAALFGALAALARPNGFLVGLFALEFLRGRRWRDFVLAASGPVAALGLWYAFPSRWTGDARKYFQIQHGFGRGLGIAPGRLLDVLWTPVLHPIAGDSSGLLALFLVLVGAAALLRRGRSAEGLFSASVVLLPLATGTVTSIARYALGAFPAIVLLGSSVKNRLALSIIWVVELALAFYLAQRFGRYWYAG